MRRAFLAGLLRFSVLSFLMMLQASAASRMLVGFERLQKATLSSCSAGTRRIPNMRRCKRGRCVA